MQILRWFAILPGSLLAAWIVYIILKFLNGEFFAFDPNAFYMLLLDCVCSYAMGFVFVYCGIRIAPSHKKHVAFVLATIGIMLMGASVFSSFLAASGSYKTILAAISCAGGIASCLWQLLHTPDFCEMKLW